MCVIYQSSARTLSVIYSRCRCFAQVGEWSRSVHGGEAMAVVLWAGITGSDGHSVYYRVAVPSQVIT